MRNKNMNFLKKASLQIILVFGLFSLELFAKPLNNTALAQAPAALDSAKVRKLYLGGDFDEAITLLESSLKEKKSLNQRDSVFIFKHLGVMYAATYETREKGKYYMHQLLQVEPTAKIMDMYASDMIYMIFKNIQEEFETNQMGSGLNRKPSLTVAQRDSLAGNGKPSGNQSVKSSGSRTWLWVGATTVVVGGGVAAYLLLSQEPAASKQTDHAFPGK